MDAKTFFTNKSFCVLPWTGFELEPNGDVKNCIISKEVLGNINDTDIKDIMSNAKNRKLKEDMGHDNSPHNCSGCYLQEANRKDPNSISSRIQSIKNARNERKSNLQELKPWVVQMGAFGRYENANRLKKQFQNNGYATEIHPVFSNGNRLHAVRIVRFESKDSAIFIGNELKKKFGLDFRIINNPE